MAVLDKLASALERNDERPNVELAEALVAKPDKAAVAELVGALTTGSVAIQNDAIKVLYEIGERSPKLVAGHADAFLMLLKSRNNRNVWGALQALDSIAAERSKALLARLDDILAAADKGSVIAKDRAMSILAKLAAAGHGAVNMPILIARLADSAPNQFPMYAELAAPIATGEYRQKLTATLEARLPQIEQPAKRERIEKVLRKLGK
jgi:hypothetical protein